MSTTEIISELSKLPVSELRIVDAKLHEILAAAESGSESIWHQLCEIDGLGKDLPEDLAEQHDHYIHGTPKQ
jgi:hypothetical protein